MRRLAALAAVAGLALIALAPAASAATPEEPPLRLDTLVREMARQRAGTPNSAVGYHPSLEFETKSGYQVEVFGFGETVALEVAREDRHGGAGTIYLVRGTVSRGRLQGSFGKLGSLSMRFRPSPFQPQRHLSCHGRHRFLHRQGLYVGKLKFRGEGGYVALDAHRAKGTVSEEAPECRGHRSFHFLARATASATTEVRGGPEYTYAAASGRHGPSSTSFLAFEGKHGKDNYLAESDVSKGRMAIMRIAIQFGAQGVIESNDALTSGRIAPPAPFFGSATYKAAPDGTKTWQGNLAVNFPGAPRFPLTGPSFDEVELSRGSDLLLFFLLLGF